MKSRSLGEMRQLVAGAEFKEWWEERAQACRLCEDTRERHEELLSQAILMDFRAELSQKKAIDTLYRAGELEDFAAKLAVESQALENSSFKAVADFEEQRFRASEVWYRACAVEKQMDQLQEQADSRRKQVRRPDHAPFDAELARLEGELKRIRRVHGDVSQQNDRELSAKSRLWEEVERIWTRSMELSLQVAEKKTQGKKVRAEAERLFKHAEERKQRAQKLRQEAQMVAREQDACEVKMNQVMKQAGDRFGCTCGEEFIYFRQKESPKRAWCLSLVDDAQCYNLEVGSLVIYSVDQKQGVQVLEPAMEGVFSQEEGDRRFEEYFLHGRKGAVRPAAPRPEESGE